MKLHEHVMRGLKFKSPDVFTIALIGGDGAGKSTIAQRLRISFPMPMKCLYMGINPRASNFALPTTHLAELVKRGLGKWGRRFRNRDGQHTSAKEKPKWTRNLRAAARITWLLPEEWYRQLISWSYQARGYCVLYDRHFAIDFEPSRSELQTRYISLPDRLHRWFLEQFYPLPDLVIFLDAPPEVLHARKGEGSLSYLEARREAFLKQRMRVHDFCVVDASLPENEVYHQVFHCISQFYEKRTGRPSLGFALKS